MNRLQPVARLKKETKKTKTKTKTKKNSKIQLKDK